MASAVDFCRSRVPPEWYLCAIFFHIRVFLTILGIQIFWPWFSWSWPWPWPSPCAEGSPLPSRSRGSRLCTKSGNLIWPKLAWVVSFWPGYFPRPGHNRNAASTLPARAHLSSFDWKNTRRATWINIVEGSQLGVAVFLFEYYCALRKWNIMPYACGEKVASKVVRIYVPQCLAANIHQSCNNSKSFFLVVRASSCSSWSGKMSCPSQPVNPMRSAQRLCWQQAWLHLYPDLVIQGTGAGETGTGVGRPCLPHRRRRCWCRRRVTIRTHPKWKTWLVLPLMAEKCGLGVCEP